MTIDGSANALSGTAQLPNLLSGYAMRPSWNVAGVDYAVGVPSGTALKDPSTISMAGASVDTNNHVVTVTGSNVTLNGYDFSLNGGWRVYVDGSNDTIENSNFAVGSNGYTPININETASNTTIKYNAINGNQLSNQIGMGLIQSNGIGTTTIEYNSITNAYSENIVIGSDTSSAASYVIQYNLIGNAGYGFAQGAHGDWIQQYNAPGDVINSLEINYNTFFQTVAPGGGGTQGLSLQSANISQGPVLSETVENNTMVATGSNTVSYAIIIDTTNLNGSATVSNNYIGPTGIAYGWSYFGAYNTPGGTDGRYNGTVTDFNNINMATGAYYPQSGTSQQPDPVTDTSSAGTSSVPSTSPSQDPSLVANGNFTTGDFTGWTLGGNYGSSPWGPQIFMDTNAVGGSKYAAAIGSMGADGTLSQTIATTAGQTYTLSFWLQNEASGTNDFKAIWNGQTLLSLTNAAQSGYTEYTYTVTATGSTSTLQFAAANIARQWDLDNISLTPSAPTTTTSPPTAPVSTASLVVNGNFETGSFSGWTLGGNYGSSPWGPQIFMDTNAVGGSKYAAAIGSMGADGTLSQTIATTAGQTYTLSFWLQNEASGTNDFKAIWNGQTLLSLTNAAQSGYTEYTYTVTATGSTSTLQFAAANIARQWDLDNISLTPGAPTTTTSPPTAPVSTATDTSSAGTNAIPNVALLTNYMASSFATSGNDQGGTTAIVEPATSQQSLVATPHH